MPDRVKDFVAGVLPNTGAYGGSLMAVFFGGLTISDVAAVVGAIVAVLSLVFNVFYKNKMIKIELMKVRKNNARK